MMLKIGYLTLDNPYNVKSFSGTGYYMFDSLKGNKNIEIYLLGEKFLKRKSIFSHLIRILKKGFRNYPQLLNKVKVFELYFFSKQISIELKRSKLDFIIAPVCSPLIANLKKGSSLPPVLFITDATPSFLSEFYNWEIQPEAYKLEKIAIDNSSLVIYSSDFMAERAKEEYSNGGHNNEKFKVVPFGLNLDNIPSNIPEKIFSGTIKLLFVGRDWQRKGGDLVISIFNLLKSRGYSTSLTIIGSNPENAQSIEDIKIISHIDKSIPVQKRKYFDILNESHFLLLPTKADCTPMVIAEANAFATPVIASNVGGIPTLIQNNKNGFLLDVNATEDDYADLLLKSIGNIEDFNRLCKSSREMFDSRLNWTVWSTEILKLGKECKRNQFSKIDNS